MLALGPRAQRSAPGGPNYPLPPVYVKQYFVSPYHKCCVCVYVCVCVPHIAVYISAAVQYQGHLHHRSPSLPHTQSFFFMPPVEGDTRVEQSAGMNLFDVSLPLQ